MKENEELWGFKTVGDISGWDLSKTPNFGEMFKNTKAFQPIDEWMSKDFNMTDKERHNYILDVISQYEEKLKRPNQHEWDIEICRNNITRLQQELKKFENK